MRVWVLRVSVPAMSTMGYGWGETIDGEPTQFVAFAGDHRPMRHLGEAIQSEGGVIVDLDDWQILRMRPTNRRTQ